MKLKTVQSQKNVGAALARARLISTFLVSVFLSASAFAQGPVWWYNRGVIDPNLPANDYAFITLGQLKWIAANASTEMNAYFGAGPGVTAVVDAFSNSGNYYYANLGQLKYVAQPFYDRLYELNLTKTFPANMPGHYPWGNAPASDYAFANIGQAKYVFSFDSAKDSDGDGLSDWREAQLGTNPYNPDTDGDSYSDGIEVQWGSDPLSASSVPSCAISGNLIYAGPQVGTIHVVLATHADGSGIIQTQTLGQPGNYTFNNVPLLGTYWIKAWRDSNGNSSKDFWEALGDSAANPVYLSGNVVNANITLSDPDTDGNGVPDWWDVQYDGMGGAPNPFFPPDPPVPQFPRPYDTSMFFPNPDQRTSDSGYSYTYGFFEYTDEADGGNDL